MADLRTDSLSCLVNSEWIEGEGLWRVGFTLEALPLITLMSGLVEVLQVLYEARENALVFIVRTRDATGTIFRKGALAATQIQMYRQVGQPIIVQSPSTNDTMPVSN